jgi:hypothetical protein
MYNRRSCTVVAVDANVASAILGGDCYNCTLTVFDVEFTTGQVYDVVIDKTSSRTCWLYDYSRSQSNVALVFGVWATVATIACTVVLCQFWRRNECFE